MTGKKVPLLQRGDEAEVRLVHQGVIELRVTTDGAALGLTASSGFLLEDPLGNQCWTTEFVLVPTGDGP